MLHGQVLNFLRKLKDDKKCRQITVVVMCLILVIVALLVFRQTKTVGVALTEDNYTEYTEDNNKDTSASSTYGKNENTRSTKKKSAKKGGSARTATVPDADVELDDYIVSVDASGTARIDANHYVTMLELSFRVEPQLVLDVTDAGYKFVYDLPEEVSIPDVLITDGPFHAYKIDSDPLELAFTYDFVDNGDGTFRIEIIFDEDYAIEALESESDFILNTLRCRCYITESGDGGHQGLDIEFDTGQTLHIPPEQINVNYDVSVYKTGSYTADGTLRYEVEITSHNGTPSAVELSDTFVYSGSGTVSAPSGLLAVLHHADGTVETIPITEGMETVTQNQNEYDMTLDLPQLDDDEYYTIIYEYTVTGLDNEDDPVSAYNNVEVTSSDGHDTVEDTSDYFIYNQQRQKIGKDGIPFEHLVQWHISVNDRGNDVAGKTVYDEGFAEALTQTINGTSGIFVQKGWQEAVEGIDYEFVYDGGGNVTGVRFLPADGSTPNTNVYHITYYTDPQVAYGETERVHNEAEFDGDTAEYDVIVTGGDIEKTADGDESGAGDTHIMDWTVTVDVPAGGIMGGTTFTDTFSPAGHTMTAAQYSALVTALETAWDEDMTISPIYTGTDITGYTFTVGSANDGYLLDNGNLNEITWHYQTTGDMAGKSIETFSNEFTDGNKTLEAENTISPNVKKLNARKVSDWQTIFTEDPTTIALNYEDDDKTFVWIAEVTPTSGVSQYRVVDTLPEGVELTAIKVMPAPLTAYNYTIDSYTNNLLTIDANGNISGEIGQLWMSKTMVSGTLSTDSNDREIVDITLSRNSANSDLFRTKFYVIYYCQLSEDMWPDNGRAHIILDNNVEVTADGGDYGEADNRIIVDAENLADVVGKSASWDPDTHLITYTVDINPAAENLLTSSGGTVDPDWLDFRDVLTYTAVQGTGTGEVVLNLQSVVLEKEENSVWSALHNIEWTAHTENDSDNPNARNAVIEMRIPDESHLRLTYTYHVNSSMNDGITLVNSATVEGHGDESGDNTTHIDVEDFTTSAESTFKEFCLVKTDMDSGVPLAGAEFTAYVWNSASEQWVSTGKTYVTDANGRIVIKLSDKYAGGNTNVYSKDIAYCIMETGAPPGYLLPENPRPFYFWFSDQETEPEYAPDDYMLTAANVSNSSHRVMAENQRQEGIPDTGVKMTNPLFTLGSLLIAGLAVIIFTKKIYDKRNELK